MSESIVHSRDRYNQGSYNQDGERVMVSGTSIITGASLLSIDTSLALIEEVLVSVKGAAQAGGDCAYVTYDHGADGLLDLYIWDDVGDAATTDTTVSWVAWGTK